ncbi:MAG TPA: alpha/beta hydrolase [Dinghuibacter sp.]|uniref:alpha/beta fold hydrolase n=1 Tax=Dinghuibacter sp. TaxID=2024697 RepID=UPI002C3FF797|nr:alpha/beta hydrolase [Dinghuibacter sp.]HTJ13530.1 alpha/beta hydrolase [Dinghuibacter sp.]
MRHTVTFACALLLLSACGGSSNKSVDDQGVNIAYTDSGKGDTTLLFVHGWDLNKGYWSNQEAYFDKAYRVVAIDLPGFGESGTNRTDWGTDDYARDIDSVISQLNLQHVVLVGHSMSGDIVLDAALHARDRVIAVVGVDNFKSIPPETPEAKADDARTFVVMKQGYKKAVEQFFLGDLFYHTPDSIQRRILLDAVNADSAIAIKSLESQHYDETPALQSWGKPIYLINSDYRPTDTAAFTKANIPYQITYIKDVGHFPMVEKPADFNAALEGYLAKLH